MHWVCIGYALGMHWVFSFIILASFLGKLQDRFKTLMQIIANPRGSLTHGGWRSERHGMHSYTSAKRLSLTGSTGYETMSCYVDSYLLVAFFLVSVCLTALHVEYTCTLFKSCFYFCSVRSVPQCYHLCELSWHSILLSTRAMPAMS